jgi:hypothetical protein
MLLGDEHVNEPELAGAHEQNSKSLGSITEIS